MSARLGHAAAGAGTDFRPAPFESLDHASIVSFGSCFILGGALLAIILMTPTQSFESLTMDQLPERVTRLLLNESDLARLSAGERAAVPAETVMPDPDGTMTPETDAAPEAPTISRVAPPGDAVGLPGSEPGGGGDGTGTGGGGGSGGGVGARGAAVAAGVAQAVAATGALAEVDRIVGDFTGVVASGRGGKALRQAGPGGGVERRTGTAGAGARTGADLGGVDEILGRADGGGTGGGGGGRGAAGTAGAGAGGGGVGRAQVRIAAPAPVASDAGPAGATRSAGALMAVVQRHAAAVRFCYNRHLQKKPGSSGQIVLRLTVTADGAVSAADVVRTTMNDTELETCLLNQAREWRFAPADEPRFTFDVPLVFTPPAGG